LVKAPQTANRRLMAARKYRAKMKDANFAKKFSKTKPTCPMACGFHHIVKFFAHTHILLCRQREGNALRSHGIFENEKIGIWVANRCGCYAE